MTLSPPTGTAPAIDLDCPGPTARHTAAMLARATGASTGAIRRWTRRGYLLPDADPRGVPAYSFVEARVARVLARMTAAGMSLAQVDRVVDRLNESASAGCRPLAEWDITPHGQTVVVQTDGQSRDPAGQMLLGFDDTTQAPDVGKGSGVTLLPFHREEPRAAPPAFDPNELRATAAELLEQGEHAPAEQLYRGLLFSGQGTALDQLALAECLYRQGDLPAARERYSVCLEADPDCRAARLSLGSVYQELGEWTLAASAFEGVLEQTPDCPDALIPLAEVCDRLGQEERARELRRRLLRFAPEGPWADDARARLAGCAAGPVVENPTRSPILQGS